MARPGDNYPDTEGKYAYSGIPIREQPVSPGSAKIGSSPNVRERQVRRNCCRSRPATCTHTFGQFLPYVDDLRRATTRAKRAFAERFTRTASSLYQSSTCVRFDTIIVPDAAELQATARASLVNY